MGEGQIIKYRNVWWTEKQSEVITVANSVDNF